uniref:U6 snRNA-associated Sm-like protein LSm8 n=1 Tax=Timema douglasi TaxID=61478 RepID=A0A7R8VCR4_TIMDO|nr:unnamed protein product [Timema douglasi]
MVPSHPSADNPLKWGVKEGFPPSPPNTTTNSLPPGCGDSYSGYGHTCDQVAVVYYAFGTLKGFDQTINLILDESHERVYSTTQGVEQVVLGLHIIRGDNVAVVGELDDNMDSRLDLSSIRAEPLNSVVH